MSDTADQNLSDARRKGAETYIQLRQRILQLKPSANSDAAGPLAVLMDWPVTHGIASVMAAADGTASIYLSNGGGFIGGGQKHQAIREQAVQTIAQAKTSLHLLMPTASYPLPKAGKVTFYVVTAEGVFGALVEESDLKASISPLAPLAQAAMSIMTQYRLLYSPPAKGPVQ